MNPKHCFIFACAFLLVACISRKQKPQPVNDQAIANFKNGYKQSRTNAVHYSGQKYDEVLLLQKDSLPDILWFENKASNGGGYSAYYANDVVIRLRDKASAAQLNEIVRSVSDLTFEVIDTIQERNVFLLRFKAVSLSLGEYLNRFKAHSSIVYAEPNFLVFPFQTINQSMVNYNIDQWAYSNNGIGSIYDADADGLEAISRYTYGREPKTPVLVAVVDGGIDTAHPSLRPVLWRNEKEIPQNKIDDDGNGYVDDIYGWNSTRNDNDLSDGPKEHGTHVAGILAAAPREANVMRGIVPSGVKLLIAKIFDPYLPGSMMHAAKGIDYAVKMKVKLMNMSFGGYDYSQTLADAVSNAVQQKVFMVAACGNDSLDLAKKPVYPACLPDVLSIAASTPADRLASFSNFDSTNLINGNRVHIAAPGTNILSTIPHGSFRQKSGTSMAAPLVTGTVAMMMALYPNDDATKLRRRLFAGAEQVDALKKWVGNGNRLNIYRALFSPFELYGANGIAYRDEIVNGQSRADRIPYANSGEPGIDGSTPAKAFRIASMKQLINIRVEDMDKHFELTNNLDWNSLIEADKHSIANIFRGKLNGNGYTICNMNIKKSRGGLFNEIGEGASVFSLRFANAQVSDNTYTAGILAGRINKAIINDVQVEGKLIGTFNVGGLAGLAAGSSFVNCYFEGTLSEKKNFNSAGGIVGQAYAGSTISGCHVKLMASGTYIGGVVGRAINSKIEKCFAYVIIKGNTLVGGIAGSINKSTVDYCYSSGDLTVTKEIAGGIIGHLSESEVRQCYSRAYASGASSGGLLGVGRSFFVGNSYYVSEMNNEGAGGIARPEYELKNQTTYTGWFVPGNPWTMPKGFSPALPLLPRSGVSLY
jgi:subtilisin family serine protease